MSFVKQVFDSRAVVNRLLVTNGVCSEEELYAAFCLSREGHKPDLKIVRLIIISGICTQLRSQGIEIEAVTGKGYTMLRESKAKLRKLVAPRGSQALAPLP